MRNNNNGIAYARTHHSAKANIYTVSHHFTKTKQKIYSAHTLCTFSSFLYNYIFPITNNNQLWKSLTICTICTNRTDIENTVFVIQHNIFARLAQPDSICPTLFAILHATPFMNRSHFCLYRSVSIYLPFILRSSIACTAEINSVFLSVDTLKSFI